MESTRDTTGCHPQAFESFEQLKNQYECLSLRGPLIIENVENELLRDRTDWNS